MMLHSKKVNNIVWVIRDSNLRRFMQERKMRLEEINVKSEEEKLRSSWKKREWSFRRSIFQ